MNDKQQLAAMGAEMAEQQQQPMCMTKRIEELEAQVRVMTGLLRDAKPYMDHGNGAGVKGYIQISKKIDAALAGNALIPEPVLAVPEVWQLVPVVPTEEMATSAGHDGDFCFCCGYDNGGGEPFRVWDAMLAAAPSPDGAK